MTSGWGKHCFGVEPHFVSIIVTVVCIQVLTTVTIIVGFGRQGSPLFLLKGLLTLQKRRVDATAEKLTARSSDKIWTATTAYGCVQCP